MKNIIMKPGMNAWINIEVSPYDKEITVIDRLEEALGNIPGHVRQIRELITRFETCHFKYQQHYRHIMESIAILQPVVDVSRIGSNHPRHSGNAWKNDTTGRSRIGHHYILALRSWLEEIQLIASMSMTEQPNLNNESNYGLVKGANQRTRLYGCCLPGFSIDQ